MSTKRILLFRHGETEHGASTVLCGSTDCLLSPVGIQQSFNNVSYALQQGVREVFTSGKKRTRLPAKHLKKHHRIPHHAEPKLDELHFGKLEGNRFDTILAENGEHWRRFMERPFEYQIPGAEDIDLFRERVLSAWRTIVDRVRTEEIPVTAIFGHALSNTLILDVLKPDLHLQLGCQPLGCLNEIVVHDDHMEIEKFAALAPHAPLIADSDHASSPV